MLYLIKVFTDVMVDDFAEGELNQVNFWTESLEIEADTKILAIAEFMNNLGYEFEPKYYDNDENYYSVLVDADNAEATELDIDEWKKGKKVLYSANMSFEVYQLLEVA